MAERGIREEKFKNRHQILHLVGVLLEASVIFLTYPGMFWNPLGLICNYKVAGEF